MGDGYHLRFPSRGGVRRTRVRDRREDSAGFVEDEGQVVAGYPFAGVDAGGDTSGVGFGHHQVDVAADAGYVNDAITICVIE